MNYCRLCGERFQTVYGFAKHLIRAHPHTKAAKGIRNDPNYKHMVAHEDKRSELLETLDKARKAYSKSPNTRRNEHELWNELETAYAAWDEFV